MAMTAIEAQERKAKTQIELSCLEAQTKLAISGLTSEAALTSFRRCRRSTTLCRNCLLPRSRANPSRRLPSAC